MGKALVSVLWILFSAVVAVRDPSKILNHPDVADNEYDRYTLPNVQEMQRGFDIATGERKSYPIFLLTYKQSEEGNNDFLIDDHFAEKTYKIPDQLTGSNWGRECSSSIRQMSSSVSSISEYLKTTSSGVDVGFDQKTDVSVKVPVEGAEVTASTQVRTALGFGQSNSAEEYYRHMKEGKRDVVNEFSIAELWRLEWTMTGLFEKKIAIEQLETGFVESMHSLKAICAESPPDHPGRMVDRKKEKALLEEEAKCIKDDPFASPWDPPYLRKDLCRRRYLAEKAREEAREEAPSKSRCDEAAKSFVERYGTHYTSIGSFGGTITKNFFYNEQTMTDVQKSYVKEYSKTEFELLFFHSSSERSKTESKYDESKMHEVVSQGETIIRGGDFKASSTGEWCGSVQLSPSIVKNEKLVVISDLIDDEASKYAVAMAILDRWYCNGGKAVLEKETGITTCMCPKNHDFVLNDYCIPKAERCYDESGKEVNCVYYQLFIGYTDKVRWLWDSTHSRTDVVSMYTPIPSEEYATFGTVMLEGYRHSPEVIVPVMHKSTSRKVAVEAIKYVELTSMCTTGEHSRRVFIPSCPEGYGPVSDFMQDSKTFPGSEFAEMKIRPCIVNDCLKNCGVFYKWSNYPELRHKSCPSQAIGQLVHCKGSPGCDLAYSGGFYRVELSADRREDMAICIDPRCVVEMPTEKNL